ncbi:MAG: diacylglycerol O-acyltransferase / wax synthase [Thermoleophilaceae bacterium]|jgi:WS/DGAT/MGAT family acyltransferase|nr:diacylglycerol O-acyltransferase / wax synthase [Thermoleophilaceae bacterium]
MQQLTSLDAQFLAIETPRTYGHVGGLAVYDPSTAPGGEITHADICRLVAERLHLLPPFTRKLVQVPLGLDHPYWIEDADFDINFHIRDSAVAPPGNDKQLANTVERIFARPLDRSRPLWELYVIHGIEGGRVALLTKIHHSVVDGVSGNEILSTLLDVSPEGREIEPPSKPRRGERAPGQLEMLGRGLVGLPTQPLRMLRSLPTVIPNLTDFPGVGAIPGAPTVSRALAKAWGVLPGTRDIGVLESTTARPPRTPFNARISAHRSFAFGSLSLESVKALKNELGITVNDVVVTLCATAVRDWLLERDALPADPLVAMVPMSVRTEEQKGTYGNRVSMMVVPIPTNVADPRERLITAHETLKGAKDRHRALPADLLTDATGFIPPAVQARASRLAMELTGRMAPALNLVISNVPGPRDPLYIAGAQLQANFPVSVVADGMGLNMTVMSYRDHVDFGLVGDRNLVGDLWPMMAGLEASLDELVEVICKKRRPKKTAAKRGTHSGNGKPVGAPA